ncbi:hypothetical protein TBLA_0A03890 [Henningerozyma blattae CBS 6284]|uniref:Peroxin-7 n=1 Tax=Henningerozyma blattae (strain ATCC 34711 / CBS 6284 / DSM 70876 / NBRC 10599 / NRRL Y-10934 / UCD 77-7) TaxID=1071380 RepID=I2GVN5_HENB6|nr:hypothetical protein TBLA_0A03890 [Tetrapisispora blattae CBS 6284]CCH58187.1 hypothetical protein TBLA_0A03890 [Tetrapisispora blattae CBS 6284]
MLEFNLNGFSGYGVQYSPFFDSKIAVVSGANYGLSGQGKLSILNLTGNRQMQESASVITNDCLFDLAWSEINPTQVLVAQGDGTLTLFDLTNKLQQIQIYKEHYSEVFSCNWNMLTRRTFISGSWDGKVKIWDCARSESVLTLRNNRSLGHTGEHIETKALQRNSKNKDCIYQALFSPHDPNMAMCCSGNSYLTFFDLRQPNQQNSILAHSGLETLSCDYNKYRSYIVASAGVDKAIRIWDLRMIKNKPHNMFADISSYNCTNEVVNAHELAIRKILWSPHHSNYFLTTSYDLTCRVWQDLSHDGTRQVWKTNSTEPGKGCRYKFNKHTEFVLGADWSLWGQPGFVASTAWDGKVFIWNAFE